MKRFIAVQDSKAVDILDRERCVAMTIYGYFDDDKSEDSALRYAESIAADLNRVNRAPFRWPWQRSTAGADHE